MTLLKIVGALACLYAAVVVAIALMQDRLLFPRWSMGPGSASQPPGSERLTIALPGGGALAGFRIPPVRRPADGAATLLGFGGNAWDAGALADYLHALFPDRTVFAFHYRGYGASSGQPSADALLSDALRIHDEISGTGPIVPVGLSIGAGPAAHLAARRPVAGVILVTPFDRLEALAREHYPWLPVRLLLRHRMEVAADIARSPAPVAIITAERDAIVPARRSDGVRRAAGRLVLDRTIAGAHHNDLYDRRGFAQAIREALHKIEADAAASHSDD